MLTQSASTGDPLPGKLFSIESRTKLNLDPYSHVEPSQTTPLCLLDLCI